MMADVPEFSNDKSFPQNDPLFENDYDIAGPSANRVTTSNFATADRLTNDVIDLTNARSSETKNKTRGTDDDYFSTEKRPRYENDSLTSEITFSPSHNLIPALQTQISQSSRENSSDEHTSVKTNSFTENEETKLDLILNKYTEGKLIKISYNRNNNFMKESTRNILVHLIIKSELDKALASLPNDGSQPLREFRIPTTTFENFAIEIERIFPSEDAATYFTGFKKVQGERILANGKLWLHYNYTKQNLRDQGVLLKERGGGNASTTAEEPTSISADIAEQLEWLKVNDQPVHMLYDVWRITFKARRDILIVEKKTASEYFNSFLALRMREGIGLIECDFTTLHQDKAQHFHNRWNIIQKHLVFRLTNATNIKDLADRAFIHLLPTLTSVQQTSIIFHLLPYLIPSDRTGCTRIKNKHSTRPDNEKNAKKIKKATLAERRDSFTLRVETAADIKPRLQQIRTDLEKCGEHLQPTVVLVGSLLEINACYVIVDETEYKVESYIHALDLAFKIFFVSNCEYPERSNSLWLFLQKGVYGIDDPTYKLPRAVVSLSKEVTYALKQNSVV